METKTPQDKLIDEIEKATIPKWSITTIEDLGDVVSNIKKLIKQYRDTNTDTNTRDV